MYNSKTTTTKKKIKKKYTNKQITCCRFDKNDQELQNPSYKFRYNAYYNNHFMKKRQPE